jgi:hypothetical protein
MGKIKLKFKPKKVETFRCMNKECGRKWEGEPGPGRSKCPNCDTTHWEWTNFYDDWYEDESDNWKWKRK